VRYPLTFARVIWAWLRLVRHPEGNLDGVLTVLDGLEDMGVGDQLLAGLPRTAELDEALEARPALLPLDMPALRSLPTDTLGRAYIDFLDTQGFDPADIPQLDVEDDGTYILNHLRETHDLWHVLTDFDVDTAGEGGLQAFYLAQVPGPLPLVLMAGILLNAVRQTPEETARRMDAITAGWTRGRRAQTLLGRDWAAQWTRPLAEVRAELQLTPPPAARAA